MNPILTPKLFDPSWTFDDNFCDLSWMGGQYAICGPEGAQFHCGAATGEQVVHVEAGLTLPEVKAHMARNPMMSLLGQNADKSIEELQSFTRVLQALEWPLRPKMPVAEVAAFCASRFPRLICTRALPVEDENIQQPMTRRCLAALDGTTLVVMHFRDDLLWSLDLTDLPLVIANDRLHGTGKAAREHKRRQLTAAALADPVQAAQEHLRGLFTAENTEHCRDLPVPPISEHEMSLHKEAQQLPDLPQLLVPPELASTHMHDIEGDVMDHALWRAQQVRSHRVLMQRHGSLEGVIRHAADSDLISHLSDWFGRNQTSMHPQSPDLKRMLEVLGTLQQQVMHESGLEGWLGYYLAEAWDAMPSLLAIGAHDLVLHLSHIAEQAQAEGCTVTEEASWQKWFEKDPRMALEEAAVPLVQAIPGQFRAWALANLPLVQAEDARLQAELARLVPRSAQEMMNAMLGRLAGVGSAVMEGMSSLTGVDMDELMPAMAAKPSGLDIMQQFGQQYAAAEHRRLHEQYSSLDELIASAPLNRLLSHACAYGGYADDQNIDHLDPALRMAACFKELVTQLELMGLEMWFDSCWSEMGRATLAAFRDAGAAALADRLQALSQLPAQKGTPICDSYSWSDFCIDCEDEWPAEEETSEWLEALPQIFRDHWSRQAALA